MFGDQNEDDERKGAWQRIGVPAAIMVFVCGAAYGIVSLMKSHGPGPRPHIEQHITSIILPPPPPPPPPPPKPQEKPLERPKEDVRIAPKLQQPKAAPKAPSAPAALTATAGPGTDAFGLKAGDGSGGDCVGSDCGSGDGSGDNGAYYAQVVHDAVRDVLGRDDRLSGKHFHGTVALVFDTSGRVKNVVVQNFTGDADIKDEIVRALMRLAANESLPADMANNGRPWVVRVARAPG